MAAPIALAVVGSYLIWCLWRGPLTSPSFEVPPSDLVAFVASAIALTVVAFGDSRSSMYNMASGLYWLSSTHTGNPVDRIGASGLVVSQINGAIRAIQAEADILNMQQIQEVAREYFQQALPYMLKAHDMNPTRRETLLGLEGIYYSLQDELNSEKFRQLFEMLPPEEDR